MTGHRKILQQSEHQIRVLQIQQALTTKTTKFKKLPRANRNQSWLWPSHLKSRRQHMRVWKRRCCSIKHS